MCKCSNRILAPNKIKIKPPANSAFFSYLHPNTFPILTPITDIIKVIIPIKLIAKPTLTFKNASTALEVAKYVPDDRILIETDSPYLAPVPYRGKRNCPVYVAEVAKKLAELRGKSFEEIAEISFENAKRVYRIY